MVEVKVENGELVDGYFAEVDARGCNTCGAGRTWYLVAPDGIAISGALFKDGDLAKDVAGMLNDAFNMGYGFARKEAPSEAKS